MRKIIYIFLLLIILCVGINVGSGSDETKANIVKDKIEDFENGINNDNHINNSIEPNIINEIAIKCNNTVDNIIKKVLKKIVN